MNEDDTQVLTHRNNSNFYYKYSAAERDVCNDGFSLCAY